MSYRTDGIMSKLKSHTIPKHLLFFDTETFVNEDNSGNVSFPFRSVCAIYVEIDKNIKVIKREIEFFYSKELFFEYIISKLDKRVVLHIFAHNIAFDLRVANLFNLWLKIDKNNEPPIINNLVFIWSTNHEKGKAKFIDTANLGVRRVKELGDDLGFPKMEVDFRNVSNEELEKYNQRDVEIIEKFFLEYLRFIDENNLGAFKLTLASQALAAFRTNFYKENIHIHSHNGALLLERDAYYGGRTEVFRIGEMPKEDYYMLDVNSMYPYCMKENQVPVRLIGYADYIQLSRLNELIKTYYCIADVNLDIDDNFAPYRLRRNNNKGLNLSNPYNILYPDSDNYNLIFPIGRFRTVLHHAELEYLIERGHINRINRIAWYDKAYVFNDYVDFFYNRKREYKEAHNKSYYLISKLFNNSLYGKFGQLEPHREYLGFNTEERFERFSEYDEVNQVYTNKLTWNWRTYNEYKLGETSFSYPAIAGSITAFARMYLYELFIIAGKDNIFYCDTDSLIVNSRGFDNLTYLLSEKELGYLDIKHNSQNLIIYGNKDYEIENEIVHKGVPTNSVWQGDNEACYIQFEGFITSWRKNSLGEMRGEYRIKSRKTRYNKGIIDEDGYVFPYVLREF